MYVRGLRGTAAVSTLIRKFIGLGYLTPQQLNHRSERRRKVEKGCFLDGNCMGGCSQRGGEKPGYCPRIMCDLEGKYNQNKRGLKTPTICKYIWQHNFTSSCQILLFNNWNFKINKLKLLFYSFNYNRKYI